MKKIILTLVAVLVVLVAVAFGVGAALPAGHVASTRVHIAAAPESVWQALTNVTDFPSWRPDVESVEQWPGDAGRVVWREHGRDGVITYERVSATVNQQLVTRIADEALPFGGTWTFDLAATQNGTQITITEEGVVRNPLFRFMSRFVFGHYHTQERYLQALGRKFGGDVEVERLAK